MNVEEIDYSTQIIEEQPENLTRQVKKIVRALRPNEEVKKIQEDQQRTEQSIIIFRLKRGADNIPLDLLAIDNIDLPDITKKVQTKRIDDLESCMSNLSIHTKEKTEEELKQETEKFKQALLYYDDTNIKDINKDINKDTRFVLKRIDPSNIFELEKNEVDFRKHYKTVYNEMHAKNKREKRLLERRKELFSDFIKGKKDNNKYKIYDVNLKKEAIHLNGKPMTVQHLLQFVPGKEKKRDFEEEGDGQYDYLYLDKALGHETSGAMRITFDDVLKGKITTHLGEEEVEFVHDSVGDDSEEEIHQNCDNFDSNGEDNPAFEYPDEEAEGLANSDSGEESDLGDYQSDDDDDDDDDDYVRAENKSKDFFNSIKNMADDNFKWPKKHGHGYME